jgi:hypothetical protein
MTARIGRTRIPYSRISFTVIGSSLNGQIVFNPPGAPQIVWKLWS